MGGLLKKLPITVYTMLIGVIAICGLGIPGVFGLSGFYSKDAIVAAALAYSHLNPVHFLLFVIPLVTAGITAFYMFRLWFYTFWGKPRDHHVYEHAHENPWVMAGPLILLAFFAAFVAWGGEEGPLFRTLTFSEPTIAAAQSAPAGGAQIVLPDHAAVHEVHSQAGTYAILAAVSGSLLAYILYGLGVVNPAEIKRQLPGLHGFLVEKWHFDTLYDVAFVRPAKVVAGWCAAFDRVVLDGILHSAARITVDVSRLDRRFDERIVDGTVNLVGNVVFAIGRSMRVVQTGRLRQYVMFIAVGVVTLFVLLFAFFPK